MIKQWYILKARGILKRAPYSQTESNYDNYKTQQEKKLPELQRHYKVKIIDWK